MNPVLPFRNSRRGVLPALVAIMMTAGAAVVIAANAAPATAAQPIPVILDSDIGDDIDDTWALALLLKSPELDLKLVVGDQGKAQYRAKLLAKFLETAGRSDVPVGVGLEVNARGEGPQAKWVKDYSLDHYPGKVLTNGVEALIDTILRSRQTVTVIAIGPLPNIKAALERDPRIATRARFVGMHGSVRKGYGGSAELSAEYNVKCDARACQAALSAAWPITITPLDTCGLVDLSGGEYAQLQRSPDRVVRALLDNYRVWCEAQAKPGEALASETRSTTLFDTVAVYLAFSRERLKIEELGIRVTDDGFTRIDPAAKSMGVATAWTDLAGYRSFLVQRLTGPTVPGTAGTRR